MIKKSICIIICFLMFIGVNIIPNIASYDNYGQQLNNNYICKESEIINYDLFNNAIVGEWQWVERVGGINSDYVNKIFIDLNENIFIVGKFFGTAYFGSYSITSHGCEDGFIAKMDKEGDFQWVINVGGERFDSITGIVTDNNDNIYITGLFENKVDFGSFSITSKGESDIFVAKLNKNGEWQWAKRGGGSKLDEGNDISVDANESVYITGLFRGSSDFGLFTFTSEGESDIFVAKLNKDGDWQWVKQVGGEDWDFSKGIDVNANGDSYLTGSFAATVHFGLHSLTSEGGSDIFVAKLNKDGDWQWAKRGGGSKLDRGNDISVDANESVYITGLFELTANFGSFEITSLGDTDIFIAKLNKDGDFLWVSQAGGENLDDCSGLSLDNESNIYITGSFYSIAVYFGSSIVRNTGEFDFFVSKLDSDGVFKWAKQAGGMEEDFGKSIDIDESGYIYVIGIFYGTAFFDSFTITSQGTEGKSDIFIAKLSNDDGNQIGVIVDNLKGGFGITAQVNNVNGSTISDLSWSIYIEPNLIGIILSGSSTIGLINELQPGMSSFIKSSGLFGFGFVLIIVSVEVENELVALKIEEGTLIGPFLLI